MEENENKETCTIISLHSYIIRIGFVVSCINNTYNNLFATTLFCNLLGINWFFGNYFFAVFDAYYLKTNFYETDQEWIAKRNICDEDLTNIMKMSRLRIKIGL